MTVKDVLNAVMEYETPKYVKVHNRLVGLVLRWVNIIIIVPFIIPITSCRSSQTLIIIYIVGWVLIHERGYQEASLVESSFITKVKGTTSSNIQEGEVVQQVRICSEKCEKVLATEICETFVEIVENFDNPGQIFNNVMNAIMNPNVEHLMTCFIYHKACYGMYQRASYDRLVQYARF
jgi:hypothetical protein